MYTLPGDTRHVESKAYMAKSKSSGKKRTSRARRSRLPTLGLAPTRRRATSRKAEPAQRELKLGYGDYQVPLFSSAELASVKTRKSRPVKKAVRKPIQAQLFQKQRPSICEQRATRKEVIFATGQGGKRGPQRPHQPKSKVRC